LEANTLIALTLVSCSILSHGYLAMWSILLVGLFKSIMFPSIFTLGIAELGDLTGKASGILMPSAVGAAVVPVMQGAMADKIGVHYSFTVRAICYVYVAFFGLRDVHRRRAPLCTRASLLDLTSGPPPQIPEPTGQRARSCHCNSFGSCRSPRQTSPYRGL
jgi:hypothetical protein